MVVRWLANPCHSTRGRSGYLGCLLLPGERKSVEPPRPSPTAAAGGVRQPGAAAPVIGGSPWLTEPLQLSWPRPVAVGNTIWHSKAEDRGRSPPPPPVSTRGMPLPAADP